MGWQRRGFEEGASHFAISVRPERRISSCVMTYTAAGVLDLADPRPTGRTPATTDNIPSTMTAVIAVSREEWQALFPSLR